jgi:hypothetical protein
MSMSVVSHSRPTWRMASPTGVEFTLEQLADAVGNEVLHVALGLVGEGADGFLGLGGGFGQVVQAAEHLAEAGLVFGQGDGAGEVGVVQRGKVLQLLGRGAAAADQVVQALAGFLGSDQRRVQALQLLGDVGDGLDGRGRLVEHQQGIERVAQALGLGDVGGVDGGAGVLQGLGDFWADEVFVGLGLLRLLSACQACRAL